MFNSPTPSANPLGQTSAPLVYYNEIDKYAAAWLRNLISAGHIAPGVVDERSIEDVTPNDLKGYAQCHFFAGIGVWSYALRAAGWPDDKQVWTGSCPCQPFSAAGKGAGFADERHLWPAWFHLIEQCRPAALFGEQVASKPVDDWVDLVQDDLEAVGYRFGAVPFASACVGAPHIRDRTYWVAHADSISGYEGGSHIRGRADGSDARPWTRSGGGGLSGGMGHASRERLAQRVGQPGVPGCEDGAGPGEATERAGIHPGGLADTKQHGDRGEVEATDHRQPQTDGPADRTGGCGGTSGGLGHADGPHAGRDARAGAGAQAGCGLREVGDLPSPPSATSRPGPTNGFWRDADWLACRDGKWRPVVASHVKVVDGPAPGLVRMRAEELQENQGERVSDDDMQTLRHDSYSEAILQQGAGGAVDASEAKVLRPKLHGACDAQGYLSKLESQQDESSGTGENGLRSMRETGQDACPPQGREPAQQRPVELEDVVSILSPSLSLAELHGDRRTAEGLRILQRSICEARPVLYAPKSVQEIWASLGKEEKDRIGLGFNASRWTKVVTFPLERGAESRVGRLRAYGNAINAQAAIAFIEAARPEALA